MENILNGKEIDIYIPSLKLDMEYNGLRWHSEEFGKDRHYYLDKLNECNKKGNGLPLSMTEYEMTKELRYYRIWDCGLIKYVYKMK